MRLRFDAEQSPEAENRVTLSRERDVHGVPRLSLSYRVSGSDRARIARGLTIVGAELERLGAATVELPPEEEALADLKLGDGTHQLGLTRMAAAPGRGVVDEHCRVHGAPEPRGREQLGVPHLRARSAPPSRSSRSRSAPPRSSRASSPRARP